MCRPGATSGSTPTPFQEYGAQFKKIEVVCAVDANQLNIQASKPNVEAAKAGQPRVPATNQQPTFQAPPMRGCYW